MALPYKIATLLYCFNERDEILLLERAQEPNRGFWSPCGGKLKMDTGESPYACACREAQEEIGLKITPSDLHLAGHHQRARLSGPDALADVFIRSEGEIKIAAAAARAKAGLNFSAREKIFDLKIPQTDREQIWPWFWQFRGGFFAAHCHCHADGRNEWNWRRLGRRLKRMKKPAVDSVQVRRRCSDAERADD